MGKPRWMILGSSPSGPDDYQIPKVDVIAAAGASITFCQPNYFFIVEVRSLWDYHKELLEAQANGTKIIVRKHLIEKILKNRTADGRYIPPIAGKYPGRFPYDILIDLVEGDELKIWENWTPDKYILGNAGMIALHWALNHGATEIHMVGMEGYRGPPYIDYCTREQTHKHARLQSEIAYIPTLQKMVKYYKNVKFTIYGTPCYQLVGKNVQLHRANK